MGPRSYQLIWQPPVMGSPLMWGSASSTRTILMIFFTTLMLVGRGMGRERADKKTGNGFLCPKNPTLKWLILCSTWPNNTHINGRYGYACLGHIHRGQWGHSQRPMRLIRWQLWLTRGPWYSIFNHIKNEFCLVIKPLYADPGENFNNYCTGQFLDSFSAMPMKQETSSDL